MSHTDLLQISETHIDHCHLSISRSKKKNYNLEVLEVLIHVIKDMINNVDVIISALMIWLTNYLKRFYADLKVSTDITFMILTFAVPLSKCSQSLCKVFLTYDQQLRTVVQFY